MSPMPPSKNYVEYMALSTLSQSQKKKHVVDKHVPFIALTPHASTFLPPYGVDMLLPFAAFNPHTSCGHSPSW